jgi:hypothetical protein
MADLDPVLILIAEYLAAAADAHAAARDIHRVEASTGIRAPELQAAENRFRRAVGAVKRCAYQLADTKPATPAGAAAVLHLVAGQISEASVWPIDDVELVRAVFDNCAAALELADRPSGG